MFKIKNVINDQNKNIVFKNLVNEWLIEKKNDVKESTFSNYSYIVKSYILQEFENESLAHLEKRTYIEYVDDLIQKFKTKTVRDILIILKSILSYANNKYNCNIKVKQIRIPKLEQDPIEILNKEEQRKFQTYCLKDNSLKSIGLIICIHTGLRIGEICALKWKNIDLDKKEICVKSTLQRIYDNKLQQTKIIIDKPKTRASMRNIPISTKLYKLLKDIEKQYDKSSFFLSGQEEYYIEPRIYRYYFKKVLQKCKIRNTYKFHILRHTFATNCVGVGMDTKSLSEILGHTTVEMTLNKYVHSSYERKKKYLERLW